MNQNLNVSAKTFVQVINEGRQKAIRFVWKVVFF